METEVIFWMRITKKLYLTCANKHVRGWWEADVFGVTMTDFWHEVEIKRSVSDYNADFKNKGAKHQDLEKSERGPNYYWFCFPPEIYEKLKDKVPDYAGILVLRKRKYDGEYIKIERPAPRRHNNKISKLLKDDVMRAIEFRYIDSLRTIQDLVRRLQYAEAGKLNRITGKPKALKLAHD